MRFVVTAFDEKLEFFHHRGEFRSLGQGGRAEGFEEVRGLAVADLRFAESMTASWSRIMCEVFIPMLHNIGGGTRGEDRLFEFYITRHHRISEKDAAG